MEPKLPPNDPDPVPPGFPDTPEPNPDEPGPDVFPQTDPDAPEPQRLQASRFAVLTVLSATLLLALLSSWGCQSESQRDADRRRAEQDINSAAYKAGEAAHKLAREAEKSGAEAARKIDESARKAREGWKEEERKDRRR